MVDGNFITNKLRKMGAIEMLGKIINAVVHKHKANPDWYCKGSVSGQLTEQIERELLSRGYALASTGHSSRRIDGVKINEHFGVYARTTPHDATRVKDMLRLQRSDYVFVFSGAASHSADDILVHHEVSYRRVYGISYKDNKHRIAVNVSPGWGKAWTGKTVVAMEAPAQPKSPVAWTSIDAIFEKAGVN